MVDEKRLEILRSVEAGELSAAEAEELLDAGAAVEPPAREEFTDITEWSPAGAIEELKIDNFVGAINARAGAETLVVATVRIRARSPGFPAENAEEAKDFFDKVKLTFDEKDGKARVKADITKGLLDFFHWRYFRPKNVSVDFDVTIPAHVTFKTALGHGSVKTEGVESIAGDLGNGKTETDARYVDYNVGNGQFISARAEEIDLDMGNGKVFIVEADALKDFELNMGNGHVALTAGRLNAEADYEMHFGNGSVTGHLGAKPTDCEIEVKSMVATVGGDLAFEKNGGAWFYRDGEPKAKVKIASAVCKVTLEVKEA